MTSRTTRSFRKLFLALPTRVQKQAREAYRFFRENPAHPGLHFKQVYSNPPMYSARVGINYRAVGSMEEGAIVWFWIGSHADYNKLLDRL